MNKVFAAIAVLAATMPSLASAQAATPIEAAAKPKKRASSTALGTQIYIMARLSRDETWVYEPATGDVAACCSPIKGVGIVVKHNGTRLAAPAPEAQDAVKPIKGIGIVVKKNGPPYPSYRTAAPAAGPLPLEGISPIKGVGVVIKKNPGTTAERAMPSADDGSATFDGALAPGTYDMIVTLPADDEAGIPTPVSLTFQVIVAADGTATSAWASRKGYQYYRARTDLSVN